MMTDADGLLAARFAATRDGHDDSDWNDVLLRRRPRRTHGRALLLAAAIVAALAVVALATPLGAAIVDGVGGFSAWITGQPGSPVSKPEQRAFDRANSRSWLGFPAGTKLRRLITVSDLPYGRTVELLGFRSGGTLCLEIVVSGKTRAPRMSCAPLAELRHSISPVHPVLVDSAFGKGTKRAWYGTARYQATAMQVTAGIAADGVRNVVVEDDSGRHTLRAESNTFLYVASDPDVGQRVTHIWARTGTALIPVPFAPAPFGLGGGVTAEKETIAGPTDVERHVRDGTIGWLDRRQPRGEPLDVLPRARLSVVGRHVVFGRVLTPDPSLPVRLAVTLSTSRHGGKATGLCSWLIQQGGSGGGCAVRADLFAENPITADISLMSGSDEFETVSGLASDDVSEITIFFASGPSVAVPLADNAFIVKVPRARMPFRLVAYDSEHRVVGILTPPGLEFGGPSPAPGRARPLFRAVSSNGASAELSVGRSTGGGRCFYVRYDTDSANGSSADCREPTKDGPALLLGTLGRPTQFVMGRVRGDVAEVELRFADGARGTIKPMSGFLLYGVAAARVGIRHEVVEAVARDAAGKRIGFESFRPPRR
jgi:hypothetical protein